MSNDADIDSITGSNVSHDLIDNSNNSESTRCYMTDALVKHLYFERILPLLPIKSNISTYQEVELNDFFLACRAVILNVGVTKNINSVIEQNLDLIEIIVNNGKTTAKKNYDEESLQSILILVRLLSDALEYYWISNEKNPNFKEIKNELNTSYEKKRAYFKSFVVGFSTHRTSFHLKSPISLDSGTAFRLIKICIKLKYNTGTLKLLKNMSLNLHTSKTLTLIHILPEYQELIKQHELPIILEKTDLTIEYILRFVAASNQEQFDSILYEKIIEPFAIKHTVSELSIVEYIELFGCIFLTNKTLSHYLKILRKITYSMKKTVFHALLLNCFSKSFIFWIMARPKEYIQLYQNLLHSENSKTDESVKEIPFLVKSLFDDVISTFNITSILTTNSTHNDQIDYNHHQHNNSSFRTTNRELSDNSDTGRLKSNSSSLHPSIYSITNLNTKHSKSTIEQHSIGTSPIFPNPYTKNNNFEKESIQSLSKSGNQSRNEIRNEDTKSTLSKIGTISTDEENTYDSTDIENESEERIEYDAKINAYYLENILELFSAYNDAELLSHTTVFRFLIILTFLDIDTIPEINGLSFKGLFNLSETIPNNDDDEEEDEERQQQQQEKKSIFKKGRSFSNSSENQSLKQFKHGLKKIKSLSTSSKKTHQYKFLIQILSIVNGSQIMTNTILIDSIRCLLSFMTIAASISSYNHQLPCVKLTKRFYHLLGKNLNVGKNWDSITNKYITQARYKYPLIARRLKLEFFAASVQLDSEKFIERLNLDEELENLNLKKLCLYTEGFRVSIHLLNKDEPRRRNVQNLSKLFQSLFSINSDILLEAYPYFDPKVTKIISSILNGPILSKFERKRISLLKLENGELMTTKEMKEDAESRDLIDECSNNWDISGILPRLSEIPTANEFFSMDSTINSSFNTNDFPILMPKAKHLSSEGNYSANNYFLSPTSENLRKYSSTPPKEETTASHSAPPTVTPCLPAALTPTRSPLSKEILSPNKLKLKSESNDKKINNVALALGSSPTSLRKSSSSSKKNTNITCYNDDARKIMMNIFSIFKRVSNYFISTSDETLDTILDSGNFRTVIKPIFVAILDANILLQTSAESFMDILILYISDYTDFSDSTLLGRHFLLCSYTITLFSAGLFDMAISSKKKQLLLNIIVKFLKARSYLIKVASKLNILDQIIFIDDSTAPLLIAALFNALITVLSCTEDAISKLIKPGFYELDQIMKFYEENIGPIDTTCIFNSRFIKEMAIGNYSSSGSVAFQRKLKNNLTRYITHPDILLLESLSNIYERWKYFSLTKYLDQPELNVFRNLAGIFATTSGILFTMGDDLNAGFREFPYLIEFKGALMNKLKYFISKQCEWINFSDLLTRENSRDILSIELHPLAYGLLFDNLNSKVESLKLVNFNDNTDELVYVLLEQLIIILRTILKKDDEKQSLLIFSNEITNFINSFTQIIEKIPYESILYYKAIIQISKMFIAIETAEKGLAIKNHFLLKNKWIQIVMNWFNNTITKEYDFINLAKPHREMDLEKRDLDFLYIDCSIETAKVLAYLTKDIPLTAHSSNDPDEINKSDMILFGNYFSILLKGLEKTTKALNYPVSLKHKIKILNENVIIALTNLSNSNVDASLKFILPMGYSENKNIRIAFLKVFINIVTNYPSVVNKDDSKKIEIMDKFLLHFIKHPQLAYKCSIVCPANDTDEYAAGLIGAFETRNASPILIDQLIRDEIENATRYADVLRRNSCGTRTLSIYAKSKGNDYLIKTLRKILIDLDERKDWFDIEKLTPETVDKDRTVNLFLDYLKRLIEQISNSIGYFPPELIFICQTIFKSVKSKFPDYAYIAVGSFVFLRFLVPSLVTPDSENIISFCDAKSRRSYITLAKVIQYMANGSDSYLKWPVLKEHVDTLSECKEKIFNFLSEICNYKEPIHINIRLDGDPIRYDYSYIHKFVYLYDNGVRNEILKDLHSIDDSIIAKETFTLFDNILGVMGQPAMEMKNEIPTFIKENIDRYPQLYEFMNRHSYRISQMLTNSNNNFIHESMSNDGFPILTFTFNQITSPIEEMELLAYKIIQIYARLWSNKYYLSFDGTEFNLKKSELSRLNNMFLGLLPDIAIQNCLKIYYINVTQEFMDSWIQESGHPLDIYQVPFEFLNTNCDNSILKSLHLTGQNSEVSQNIRVSIHDIQIYDENKQEYTPVKLKLGDRYFQVFYETPKVYKLKNVNLTFKVNFNEVYEVIDIESVYVSSNTNSNTEFTVTFYNGRELIFSSTKYLEIVKMFYYAQSKSQSENYNQYELVQTASTNSTKEKNEIICHFCLIILVGLFDENDAVKYISYNLMVAVQNTFNLNFGTEFYHCSEIFIPEDTTSFLTIITKSLCTSSPELTPYVWKYMVEGLETGVVHHESVPTIICCLSLWIPTMYGYVYLMDGEDGPELVSKIIRTLIKLTVRDSNFTTLYLQQIWYRFALDGRLTEIIVEEIVSHALERDSEDRDWKKATTLLTCFPTIEIASHIVNRFIRIIRSFLPSIKLESSTRGWSEITILSKLSVALFFESPLLCQMYLPEILFIISLLIDIGPSELRLSLHKLLMNICHSLILNKSLSKRQRGELQKLNEELSRQKVTLMSGYIQDKSTPFINHNSPSLSSKFGTLEHFISNILDIMECSSPTESAQWKTKYKKYLMDSIFTHHSFLSARAMMILGIMGKNNTSEILCRDLLVETMKLCASPILTEETLSLSVAHSFTYSKIVEGLDPSLELIKQLFWLSTTAIESPHQIQFESGMLFMINCLDKLYASHFENTANNKRLPEILMNSRIFASGLLEGLEDIAGVTWTNSNFPHILIGFIMRGLSIPVLKGPSIECLKSLFRNSYLEMERDLTTKTFFCYLFTIYLLFNSDQFRTSLDESNIHEDMVTLDDHNQIPKRLADWLASDHICSNIALYQGALLFSSSISDDGCKLRFALIMRYLLLSNPVCLFRFYLVTRKELRRISSLEQNVQTVLVAFDIIGMLVTFDEYNRAEQFYQETLESLEKRGLSMISKIDLFDNSMSEKQYITQGGFKKVLYNRKRLLTMILARMSCYM